LLEGGVTSVEKDEYVRILDYLSKGKSEVPSHKRTPIAQCVGETHFSLLEITPKPGESFELGDRVYIGEGERDKVDHIERRIKFEWLTPTAKSELNVVVPQIVAANEERFLEFYNTAGSISVRQHKLEILPKIGRRHRQDILTERDAEPFTSFQDMVERVKNIPDPVKVIAEKIVEELKGQSKYYLFVPIIEDKRR